MYIYSFFLNKRGGQSPNTFFIFLPYYPHDLNPSVSCYKLDVVTNQTTASGAYLYIYSYIQSATSTSSIAILLISARIKMSSFHDQLMKPPNDEEDFMLVMELSLSSLLPMTMKASIELGVLEILAKASPSQLSSSEIASQLPTNNQEAPTVLDRMLQFLASYSFLICNLVTNKDGNVFRVYGLASVCRWNEDRVSLAPIFLLS